MDVLSANPNLTQFVCALQATGLNQTLMDVGPYTVFAPTNIAFERLDPCTRNLIAEDPSALRNILLYHIAYGYLRACDLRQLNYLGTLNGSPLALGVRSGRQIANGIILRKTDIMACNGVIHTVDTIIVPPTPAMTMPCPPARSYMGTIAGSENFTVLETAIKTAGLEALLSTTMPITVLAPTDDAFAKIPRADMEMLMGNPVLLRQVLLYHILPGRFMAADLRRMVPVNTFLGVPICPVCIGTAVRINGANVVTQDVAVGNGVVQVLDSVLLPQVPPCTACPAPAPRPAPCPTPCPPRCP